MGVVPNELIPKHRKAIAEILSSIPSCGLIRRILLSTDGNFLVAAQHLGFYPCNLSETENHASLHRGCGGHDVIVSEGVRICCDC